uniref:hypothetical protein n=1 Tax=Leeuwenhoekiella sp. UBA6783 TaxID=1946747 RepID=UPI0025BD97BB
MRIFRILLLIPLLSYSQNKAPRALIDKALIAYETQITDSQFVNDKTLNILIGDVLNQYLPSTKISTQRLS